MFKRKIYNELLNWKNNYGKNYAVLVEGARRVGKSTIVNEITKQEFKSYISIDISNITDEIKDVFKDISNFKNFFRRLQLEANVTLYKGKSCIVFDEI